jgi:hypothetical protein
MGKFDDSTDGLSDFAREAFEFVPKDELGERRDVFWLRWLKFGSLIAFPAIVFGLVFLFEDYARQTSGATYSERQRAERLVERDTMEAMEFRFVLGAGLGGGLGLVYVVRCIVRKVDP